MKCAFSWGIIKNLTYRRKLLMPATKRVARSSHLRSEAKFEFTQRSEVRTRAAKRSGGFALAQRSEAAGSHSRSAAQRQLLTSSTLPALPVSLLSSRGFL